MKVLKLLILLPIVLLLTACPEDDPVKPDPCDGKKPIRAEFDIMESNYWGKEKYFSQSDTILYANIAIFNAKEENASYLWRIGDDDREFTTSKVSLRFLDVLGDIPIRLIVYKKPDTLCFPSDDGIDTITKTLFVKKFTESDMIGNYWGVNNDAPKDSFLVSIGWYHSLSADNDYYYINNLPNGCNDTMNIYKQKDQPIPDDVIGFKVTPLNKLLIFESHGQKETNCLGATGTAILTDGANNIEIVYSSYAAWGNWTRINRKFIGRRVK